MKKAMVALVLACSVAAIAYASLNNRNSNKQVMDKQQKSECKKRCVNG